MSNIAIRKNNGGQVVPTAPVEWEPYRMIRNLMGWDPFREMAPLWPEERAAAYLPAFEVKETKDGFVFKADLPGLQEKDLDIQLTGNRLTLTGKREAEQQEQSDTYFLYERSYGSFTRAFTLPDGVDADHIRAELKDGVLNLVLPKKPEMQPKKIAVKAGEQRKS
jgi:HSP20 family protein